MRKRTGGVLVAVVIAVLWVRTSLLLPSICNTLTPDNWILWWWYGCDKDTAGGGGGGAG
jgi:hypothetical protein